MAYLSRKDAEAIVLRLQLMAAGDPNVVPVTEREIAALRDTSEWEKVNSGFFGLFVSQKQAKLYNELRSHRQVVYFGGIRSLKTSFQAWSSSLIASGFRPDSYETFYTEDGQTILKPHYIVDPDPIIKPPVDIAICILDRGLQRKPGGFEAMLSAMLPAAWIKRRRTVADYTEYFLLNNGSKIWLLSAESGYEKMQGATYGVVVMDESQDEKVFNELVSRVGRRAPILIMGFHSNRGRNWAYDLFIKPEEQHKTPHYRHVERATMLDNPFIPLSTKEEMIEEWREEGQLEARLYGAIDDLVGIVYKSFSKERHVVNASDIPEFVGGEPPKDWPVISGLDCHHTEKGCAASWLTINPDNGRCYLFHEYESTADPATWINDLNEIDKKYPSRFTFADPSMDATDNRGFNLWNEFRIHCTLPLVKAKRDHAQGIQSVISALANLRDEKFDVVDKKPGLLICDHCVRTIEQLRMYHRKTGAVNDVVKVDDEFCDTLRYMMVTQPGLQFLSTPKDFKENLYLSAKTSSDKPKGAFIFSPSNSIPQSEKKGAFLYSPLNYKKAEPHEQKFIFKP